MTGNFTILDPACPQREAVQLAKFQSGIAALPFSSPRLAVKQRVQVQGGTFVKECSPILSAEQAMCRPHWASPVLFVALPAAQESPCLEV